MHPTPLLAGAMKLVAGAQANPDISRVRKAPRVPLLGCSSTHKEVVGRTMGNSLLKILKVTPGKPVIAITG